MPVIDMPITEIDYTNWRGERAVRKVHIEQIIYMESEWHKGDQWIVQAYDPDRGAMREFAAAGIHSWRVGGKLLSHQDDPKSVEHVLNELKKEAPDETSKALLDDMASSDFGRFYLVNRGLNGYWTEYLISHPQDKDRRELTSDVERFFLERAPLSLATQERALHFQRAIKSRLKPGMVFASIPCGLMGDFLNLDQKALSNIRMIGIDLDPYTLMQAATWAEEKGVAKQCEFRVRDAWNLDSEEEFDILTSNGLNIYEPDEDRVRALLGGFYKTLKPGGVLITSSVTPPPTLDPNSEWLMEEIDLQALMQQKTLFVDLVKAGFTAYQSTKQMTDLLVQAGFKEPEIVWDRAHLFPTLIAEK